MLKAILRGQVLFMLGIGLVGCNFTGGNSDPNDPNVADPNAADPNDPNESNEPVAVNTAPAASAGPDQVVRSGAEVVLNGSSSVDAEGDRLHFSWRQTSGSPIINLTNAFSSVPRFFAPSVRSSTTFTFRVTVSDGGHTTTDEATVTVNP